jgi:hypothetical protein
MRQGQAEQGDAADGSARNERLAWVSPPEASFAGMANPIADPEQAKTAFAEDYGEVASTDWAGAPRRRGRVTALEGLGTASG